MATVTTRIKLARLLALIGCCPLAMWAGLLDLQGCVDDEFCKDRSHVVSFGPGADWLLALSSLMITLYSFFQQADLFVLPPHNRETLFEAK